MIPRLFDHMRAHKILMAMLGFAILVLLIMLFAATVHSQAYGGAMAQMTVTATARPGILLPSIPMGAVRVTENNGKTIDPVMDLIPAQGNNAGLELLVVIDDGSSWNLASHFDELRGFMEAQPETTTIGVGYMHNGKIEIEQEFTADHALAAKTLRMPMGVAGISGSPYFAMQDLTKHWPAGGFTPRHEVLWITDGSDPYNGGGATDPQMDAAAADLQRADVVVYSIYEPGAGRPGSLLRLNRGQSFLTQISEKTGGEAYCFGSGAAISFAPYLSDVTRRLRNQYLLEFLPMPQPRPGLQPVHVFTEMPGVDLSAADAVFVPSEAD